MARPKPQPKRGRSRVAHVRLYPEEAEAFKQLAETLGETPSRLLRRLMREAVTGRPDYFIDGVYELRAARSAGLAAIGRNLNQLTRLLHRGQFVAGEDVRWAVNACNVQTEAVKQVYMRAIRATMQRIVLPLYEAAGLYLPTRPEALEPAGPGPGRSRPGPASGAPAAERGR